VRWLYHLVTRETPLDEHYAPPSLAREGFVHLSFRDDLAESARRHFAHAHPIDVWQVDPRRLDANVTLDDTPRGPMPHLRGAIPRDAVRAVIPFDAITDAPDLVRGHSVAFVAFEGMTLLDLVGVHDPVSRIRTMGFDPAVTAEIISATDHAVWTSDHATLSVARVRPPLDAFDLVVVPGGLGARALAHRADVIAWLKTFPPNRMIASVCTGSLLLGAAGRLAGRRATTHFSAYEDLAAWCAEVIPERVVTDGPVHTAGGVTSGIDLGIHLVRRLTDEATARAIARQMEHRFA
jgi:cyclohexyl-isocyanide hydratase